MIEAVDGLTIWSTLVYSEKKLAKEVNLYPSPPKTYGIAVKFVGEKVIPEILL